jgi:hypothetical protein
MKKLIIVTIMCVFSLFTGHPVKAQSEELQQLILNLEKLNQLRSILDQLYKGYAIISKGYTTIKDLSQGNFNLHKLFLDKLLEVSPVVRQYKRIGDIIADQRSLVKEYKAALRYFKELNVFERDDLSYIESVYNNLFNRSLKNLDELLMVVTANQLRMNDAERLNSIDRIHSDVQDKLVFLRSFNEKTKTLAMQRQQELRENKALQNLFGIEH